MAKKINIAGTLNASTTDGVLGVANQIKDEAKGKMQSVLNQEFDAKLSELGSEVEKSAVFDEDNNIVKNPIKVVSNPEYIECHVDENGKILYGVKRNGEFVFNLFENANKSPMMPTHYTDIENMCLSDVTIPTQLFPSGSGLVIMQDGKDFSEISVEIKDALSRGENNIVVIINQDAICDKSIDLNYIEYPNANITITGRGGLKKVIGSDVSYGMENDGASIGGNYIKVPHNHTFDINNAYSSVESSINLYDGKFYGMNSLVEFNATNASVNKYKGVGIIRNTPYQDKDASECTDLFVQITQWYLCPIYKVSKIEDGVIYFECETSEGKGGNGVALNNDFYFAESMPRYRLLNHRDGNNLAIENGYIYIPLSMGTINECGGRSLVNLDSCKLRSITITNLYISNNLSLKFPNTAEIGSINICGNTFANNNDIVIFQNSPNYHITHNTFVDCNNEVIRIEQGGKYGEVKYNLFKDCGKKNVNTFCVRAAADQVLIKENYFTDYGYGAIGVGEWWGVDIDDSFKCNVVVERNVLAYTRDNYNRVNKMGLMDSGAMYAYTNNTLSIFRYNVILNYTGAGSNRGIFLDDGAYNVMVYGNIILGVDNSYSIDSRLVSNVSSKIAKHNTNNVLLYNIVNSPYKLEGREDFVNEQCLKGVNVQLHTNDDKMENDVSWCNEEPDYHITEASIDNGVLLVPKRFNKMVQDVLPKELLSQIHFTY